MTFSFLFIGSTEWPGQGGQVAYTWIFQVDMSKQVLKLEFSHLWGEILRRMRLQESRVIFSCEERWANLCLSEQELLCFLNNVISEIYKSVLRKMFCGGLKMKEFFIYGHWLITFQVDLWKAKYKLSDNKGKMGIFGFGLIVSWKLSVEGQKFHPQLQSVTKLAFELRGRLCLSSCFQVCR